MPDASAARFGAAGGTEESAEDPPSTRASPPSASPAGRSASWRSAGCHTASPHLAQVDATRSSPSQNTAPQRARLERGVATNRLGHRVGFPWPRTAFSATLSPAASDRHRERTFVCRRAADERRVAAWTSLGWKVRAGFSPARNARLMQNDRARISTVRAYVDLAGPARAGGAGFAAIAVAAAPAGQIAWTALVHSCSCFRRMALIAGTRHLPAILVGLPTEFKRRHA